MARTPKVVEDRREQIIDAAMRVFSQKGFMRATNKDIAQEAGITPGLIYHYFENKEAVLHALIEERSPIVVLRTLPPQMLELPPDVLIRHLLLQVLGIVEGEKFVQLIRVFVPEIIHNPSMAGTATAILQQALSFISSYFTSKMERGELRRLDAAFAAQTLLGSLIGFVLRRQILHDPMALSYSHEQLVEHISDIVLQGLLPR